MAITVLHIAHYAASYRGNFISSLEKLEEIIKNDGGKTIYMFPDWAKTNEAKTWIDEMINRGKRVYYFSGNTYSDAKLIRKIVSDENVDIVHTHFLPAKFQVAVKLACVGKKVSQVVHFHNHSENKQGLSSAFRKVFYKNSVMIACGKSVYKSVCRDYPSNISYEVDNGIDPSRLKEYTVLTHQELTIDNDYPVCLMFGFDFERKGVDLACLAVQKLWEEGERVNLLISVSSNYDLVKEKIEKLLGSIPEWLFLIHSRSDVASLYNSCELFLSPSREEGLPYSALEACYSSCAVVLSDIEAQQLDIPYTLWFKNNNAQELCSAIVSALQMQKQKKLNLEEARADILSKYSVDSWAAAMKNIYQDILK